MSLGRSVQIEEERRRPVLRLLVGFLVGCLVAAIGVFLFADWAWLLPTALAAVVLVLR